MLHFNDDHMHLTNHLLQLRMIDLEGLDEFPTDKENLDAFLECFEKDTPYFYR